ncbi:hypothetical protein [Crossiella sp. NPDC003009]
MSVHVSVVPDEGTTVSLLTLSAGQPMLAIADSHCGVTFTVRETPDGAAQAVLVARELVRMAGEFAALTERYARHVASAHLAQTQQQQQREAAQNRHELQQPKRSE